MMNITLGRTVVPMNAAFVKFEQRLGQRVRREVIVREQFDETEIRTAIDRLGEFAAPADAEAKLWRGIGHRD